MKKACLNAGLLALWGIIAVTIQLQIDQKKFRFFFCVN